MEKLYAKDEILFAVFWIILYCVVSIPIRGNLGDESPVMLLALALIAAGITLFIHKEQLWEKYGLTGWPKDSRRYLYFIPVWILSTGNLWGGFHLSYDGVHQVCAVLSMALIGYVEEVIFRGFLFKGMLVKDGEKVSIAVSSITFGIGHLVNLFAGQATLESVLQVIFAVAWGFIFTMLFYTSGSLLPGILAHALVDFFSKFGDLTYTSEMIYIIATIAGAVCYCGYLHRAVSRHEVPDK